jgi:hypothetical protein
MDKFGQVDHLYSDMKHGEDSMKVSHFCIGLACVEIVLPQPTECSSHSFTMAV